MYIQMREATLLVLNQRKFNCHVIYVNLECGSAGIIYYVISCVSPTTIVTMRPPTRPFKERFPKRLNPQYELNKFAWALSAITGIWLGFTFLYAFAVRSTNIKLARFVASMNNPTMTVRVLRVLSEGVALLLTALISCTLDTMLWTAASMKKGVSLSTILGLSRATGVSGLLELLFVWRKTRSGRDHHRLVASIR